MTRAWTRSCAVCCVRKGLIFLKHVQAVFAMWSLKVSWSSKITPRFLTELDGVIVAESIWMVNSCCRVGVAGKTRSSVFARLSCRWCSFIHAEMSARQPEMRLATVGSSGSKWEIELCVISIAMVVDTMCLYDGTQWCSACGEEEGSNNRSLRNPSDQLMCSGFLPSPGHLEGPASEIGLKPAKWNPCYTQWWEGGQEDLMVNCVKISR